MRLPAPLRNGSTLRRLHHHELFYRTWVQLRMQSCTGLGGSDVLSPLMWWWSKRHNSPGEGQTTRPAHAVAHYSFPPIMNMDIRHKWGGSVFLLFCWLSFFAASFPPHSFLFLTICFTMVTDHCGNCHGLLSVFRTSCCPSPLILIII